MSAIINIKQLSKSYENKHVLRSLDWEIQQGDIVALLGKNGAGKTTLLESVMSLLEFQSGEVLIWGQPWKGLKQEQRERISFVAQDTSGFEWMKVKTYLSFMGGFFSNWDKSYVKQLCNKWQLDSTQQVGKLSGGQKQILRVIQALSSRPEIIILDEPVAHLDPNMRRQFLAELIDLSCDNNTTVIFSSHIVSDLERVANKVALLVDGVIQSYYEIEQLKSCIGKVKIPTKTGGEVDTSEEKYAKLVNWHHYSGGATASLTQPVSGSIDEYIASLGDEVEFTPLSLEDWYLEVSNEGS